MSDTQTAAPVKRRTEARTMVKMKAFGDAKFALAAEAVRRKVQPEDVSSVMVGRVIGVATKVSTRQYTDPKTGEIGPLMALMGSFRATPADLERNITTSARLGLPEHIMQPVVDMFAQENPPQSVTVAWDIGVERSNNAVGYSWFASPLMDEDANDPLALLEAKLAARTTEPVKALDAPQTLPPLTAPAGERFETAAMATNVNAHAGKRK